MAVSRIVVLRKAAAVSDHQVGHPPITSYAVGLPVCFKIVVVDLVCNFGDPSVVSAPEGAVCCKVAFDVIRERTVDFLISFIVGAVELICCIEPAQKIAAVLEFDTVGMDAGEEGDKVGFLFLHEAAKMRQLMAGGKGKIVFYHSAVVVCFYGERRINPA